MSSAHFFDCHVCPNNHYFQPANEACYLCGRPPSHIVCRFCRKLISPENYADHISIEKGEISFYYVLKLIASAQLFYSPSALEYNEFVEEDRRNVVVPTINKLLKSNNLETVVLPELRYGQYYCFKLKSALKNEEGRIFTLRLAVHERFIGIRVSEEIAKHEKLPIEPFKSVQDLTSRLNLNLKTSVPKNYTHCYIEGKVPIPVVSELYPSCNSVLTEDGVYNIFIEYCTEGTRGPSLYSFMRRFGYEHYYELFQCFYLNSLDSLRWAKSRTWIADDIYQTLRKKMMKEMGHSDPWYDSSLFTFRAAKVEVPTNWKGLKVKVKVPSQTECSAITSQCCSSETRVCMALSAEARKIYRKNYNYRSEDKYVVVHEVCKVSQLDIRECTKCQQLHSQDLDRAATEISFATAAVPIGLKITAYALQELCSKAQSGKITQFILPSVGSTFLRPDTYKRMITDERFAPVVRKSPVFQTATTVMSLT